MTRTHGHNVARSSPIPVPSQLGTPGAVNSAYKSNMGPVYRDLNQDPVVPNANEAVKVTVRISDSDGVISAVIKYRRDTVSSYSQAVMYDNGTNGDETAGDGVWTGTIPGQPANTVMEFYVEAADGAGNITQFPPLVPPDAPSTVLKNLAIYRVGDKQSVGSKPLYRITLTRDGETALNTRRSLSNHLVPCSFVLNEQKIFYNCGQRFRGSPWIRGNGVGGYAWSGIRIRFPADDKLFGAIEEINLDSSGHTNQHDRTAYYLERKMVAATPGVYNSWSWGRYVNVRYKAGSHEHVALYDHLQKVDADYLAYWWRGHGKGTLHKVDDWFEWFNDGSNRQYRQAAMTYHGADKENYYRQNFKLRGREKSDSYRELIDLCYALTSWPSTKIDSQIETIMDVKQWTTILSVRLFIDDWDTLGVHRGKNSYLYLPSPEGDPAYQKWQLVPWDSDLTFGNTGAVITPGSEFPQLIKLYARPWVKRMLYADYRYLMAEVVESRRLSAWLSWVAGSVGIGGTELNGWCQSRASYVMARLPSDTSNRFSITSPTGDPYFTTDDTVTVTGKAPNTVDIITLNGEEITEGVRWSGSAATIWQFGPIPLENGLNTLEFVGFRRDGVRIGSDTLRVRSEHVDPPAITSVSPQQGSATGGDTVTIRGANFENGATVKFGGVESPSVVWVNEGELRAETPPHSPGDVVLTVENPTELKATYRYFTYLEEVNEDFHIALDDVTTSFNSRFDITVRLDFDHDPTNENAGDIQGWSYGICHDADLLTPIAIEQAEDTRSLRGGQGPGYYRANLPDEIPGGGSHDGVTVAVVVDFTQQVDISPQNGWKDAIVTYKADCPGADCTGGPLGVGTEIVPCDKTLGDPPVEAMMVVKGQVIRLYSYDSAQVYIEPSSGFVRGNANGDDRIDIADAIFVLGYLFGNGTAPEVPDSADANDDGGIDIADAIYILGFLFGGGPPPPPPYPDPGTDPTPDSL